MRIGETCTSLIADARDDIGEKTDAKTEEQSKTRPIFIIATWSILLDSAEDVCEREFAGTNSVVISGRNAVDAYTENSR